MVNKKELAKAISEKSGNIMKKHPLTIHESKKVVDIYNNNLNIAEKIGLKATPTVFYNELLDMSRKKYIIGE